MTDLDRYPTPERTGLEPRVFEPISRADTDSWTAVVADVIRFAEIVNDTEFVPKGLRGSMPATAAAMLYGREVGLPPMTALSSTHVVDGRPAISAEAMRALVFAAGHEIVFDEMTAAECRMRGRRRGSDGWLTVSWTLSQARTANLLRRDNWQKYPRAMLAARATAELCRLVFPDVIHGFAAVEEIDGPLGGPETGAESPEARTPAAKPVRRRTGRVASGSGTRRPAAESGSPTADRATPARDPRPVDPGDLPPLPGEPGFGDDGAAGRAQVRDSGPAGDDGDTLAESSPVSGAAGSSRADVPDAGPVEGTVVDEPTPATPLAPRGISRAQQRMMLALFGELDVEDRGERLSVASTIVGRKLTSSNDLSNDEASGLIDTLSRVRSNADLGSLIEHIRQAEQPALDLDPDGGDPS